MPPARIAEAAEEHPGAARRARLPQRRRRPRLGREPALHAHPGLRQAGGRRALRARSWRKLVELDPRRLRRLAQGRARHRRQHGAVRRARVGANGDRDDVADQGSSPTRTACSARASSSTAIPAATSQDLKTTPEIEEVATTCVECGFCEPVCPSRDLTTTPRQRIVLRREMARQPAGLAAAREAARGVRVRRPRDLRRRRHLRARPARSGSTPASSSRSSAPPSTARARSGAALRAAAALGPRRGRRARRPRAGAAISGRSATRPLERRHRRRPRGRSAPSWSPAGSRRCRRRRRRRAAADGRATARRPSTCPPASTGSSAATGGAGADATRRRRRCRRRSSPSRSGPGGRSGSPTDVAGQLLRDARGVSKGYRARRRVDGRADRRRRSGAGRTAASCRS